VRFLEVVGVDKLFGVEALALEWGGAFEEGDSVVAALHSGFGRAEPPHRKSGDEWGPRHLWVATRRQASKPREEVR
jgi:hypothetical protein